MMSFRAHRRLAVLRNAAVTGVALAALSAAPALAHDRGGRFGDDHGGRLSQGAVYTQTNDPAGNHVVVFARNRDGTITQEAERGDRRSRPGRATSVRLSNR